jgi:hypothetical protein
MRKLKGAGPKPAQLARNNMTGSIRGRISAPIPLADDDFPISTPRAAVSAPMEFGESMQQRRDISPPSHVDLDRDEERNLAGPVGQQSREGPSVPPSTAPSYQERVPQARKVSPFRGSNVGHKSNLDNPRRKKSTMRTVFGRLFGKRRKSLTSTSANAASNSRAGLHRSVS